MLTLEDQHEVRDAVSRVQQRVSATLQKLASAQQAIDFTAVLHANLDKAANIEAERGPPPQCKAGCSHCCSVRVEASDAEALNIAQYLQASERTDFDQLENRLRENAYFHLHQAGDTPGRIDCAFLHDHRCSIYDVRPATCRKAHSLSVSACERGAAELPQNLALLIQCEVLINGTNAAFQGLNLPASANELSAAVLAAMAGPDVADAWYQGTALLSASTPP